MLRQFVKFCLVGGLNTLVDIVVLNLLIFAFPAGRQGWLYSLFKAISFLCAATNSYLVNRRFTFDTKTIISTMQVTEFLFISGVGLAINVGVATTVATFVTPPAFLLAYWPTIAAISGVPVGLVWDFVGYRYIVFRKDRREERAGA